MKIQIPYPISSSKVLPQNPCFFAALGLTGHSSLTDPITHVSTEGFPKTLFLES